MARGELDRLPNLPSRSATSLISALPFYPSARRSRPLMWYGARVESEIPLDPRQKYALAPRLPRDGPVDVRSVLTRPSSRIEIEIGPGRGGFLLGRVAAREDVG